MHFDAYNAFYNIIRIAIIFVAIFLGYKVDWHIGVCFFLGAEHAAYVANIFTQLESQEEEKMSKKIYIILSHCSNENIGLFNAVELFERYYGTLDEAKAVAEYAFQEDLDNDLDNGFDRGKVEPISADDCTVFDTAPEFCIGEVSIQGWDVYHNLYAVFALNEQ